MAKPFEKKVLAQRMREILDRRPEAAQVVHPPAEPGAQSSGQTPNEPEAPASEFRGVILIVDDDPAVLDSAPGPGAGHGIAENFIAKPYDAQRLDRRIQGLIAGVESRQDDTKNDP